MTSRAAASRVSVDFALAWLEKRGSKREFVKRGGFGLMACLALYRKDEPDRTFLAWLSLIEKGAADERNFVMKALNWALRAIGRRNAALREASIALAKRLADSMAPHTRWVGKDALRQLRATGRA